LVVVYTQSTSVCQLNGLRNAIPVVFVTNTGGDTYII